MSAAEPGDHVTLSDEWGNLVEYVVEAVHDNGARVLRKRGTRSRVVVPPPVAALDLVRDASDRLDQAREARDQAIRAAHRDGLTIREIAPAAGLSPARVGQIVQAGA